MEGGAKPYLPLPSDITTADQLKANMDFVYVSCHGVQDETVFLVPDNTFILFRGPSGVSIPLSKTEDELLNKVKYLPDRKRDNESNAAKIEAKKNQWWQQMFTDIQSKEFLKEILFNPADPEQPKTTAIYTPGDIIQNLKLVFENNRPIFFLVGIYDLPMRRCVRDDLGTLNRNYFEEEEQIVGPILDTFLKDNGMNAIATNIDIEFKDKLKYLADKDSGAPITDEKRLEFLEAYSKAIKTIRSDYTIEQYNISNCPGRANNKLTQLGIGPTPCTPPLPGFQNECGATAVTTMPTPADYSAERSISLHKLVTESLKVGPFTKKYKFILVEACRALPESYLEMQELIKYGIQPKGIGFNEAATLEVQAREGKPIEKAQRLYRSRRYSLNVRELEDVCFTTLLRLSRDRLRLLPPTAIKNKLLSGQPVTINEFDGLTRQFRNVDEAIRSLPRNKQFKLLQPVSIDSNSAAVRQGIIQGAVGLKGNNSRPIQYSVRTLGNNGQLKVESIAPSRLTRKNRLNLPAEQQTLLTTGNVPLSSTYGIVAPDPRNFMTISNPYGKTFQIRTNAAPKEELEAKLDVVPFKEGDDVYVKFLPQAEKAKQPLGGKHGYITSYIDYVDRKGKPQKEFKFLVRFDDKTEQWFFADFLVRSRDEIGKAKDMAGGGNQKLANTFCSCIKKVRRTVKARGRNQSRKAKESAAIGICVKSVLGTRKRTLKRFTCRKKATLTTQKPK